MKFDMLNAVLMLEEEERQNSVQKDGSKSAHPDKLADRMREYQEVKMLTEHLFELKE